MKFFTLLLCSLMLCTGLCSAASSSVEEPQIVFVNVDGADIGEFILIQAPSSTTEVILYQDGEDRILRKRPGRSYYGDIVISRNQGSDQTFWSWYQTVVSGKVERKCVTLDIKDKTGAIIDHYVCLCCWPFSWEGGVTETVGFCSEEISHEYMPEVDTSL